MLEGEAGFNDPVAVLLVLGFIEWIKHPDYGLTDLLVLFVQQMGIGLVAGVAVGSLAVAAFRRVHLATPGLYPVASLTAGIVAFGAADTLHGSGFLAVFICGLALGQRNIPARTTVAAFHEGLAWVGQLTMFLTLGLLVTRQELDDVVIEGTLLALIVLFVARPVATFISTIGMRFTLRETTLLSWAGLRGAVPVVLATFPVLEGTPHSGEFFNIVFFAVLLSTVVQGTTVEPLARRLKVTTDEPALPPTLIEVGAVRALGADVIEHVIRPTDAAAGARLRDLGLPRDALVSLILRGEEALLPRGSTRVEAGDRLLIIVRHEVAGELPQLLERWRAGPIHAPVRPPRTYTGTVPIYTTRPWTADDGDPAHPRAGRGPRGRRAPAHAARRAGRAGHPRGRPLRGHRADPDGRPFEPAAGPGPAPAHPGAGLGRAGLVAGGDRRLRAIARRRP